MSILEKIKQAFSKPKPVQVVVTPKARKPTVPKHTYEFLPDGTELEHYVNKKQFAEYWLKTTKERNAEGKLIGKVVEYKDSELNYWRKEWDDKRRIICFQYFDGLELITNTWEYDNGVGTKLIPHTDPPRIFIGETTGKKCYERVPFEKHIEMYNSRSEYKIEVY